MGNVARMMARLGLVAGIALLSFGYSKCTFVSGDGDLDPGDGTTTGEFSTTLTLRDSSGTTTTSFVMGEAIRFEIEILNRTAQPRSLDFPDAQIYDFYVFASDSSNVRWRWSEDMAFPQTPVELDFPPNSSKSYSVVWDGVLSDGTQLPAGSYRARGVIVSDDFSGNPLLDSDMGSDMVNFTVR
jgi:hypothetical protein